MGASALGLAHNHFRLDPPLKPAKLFNVKKSVTIHSLEDQDRLRREEMRQLTPSERITALLHYRDRAFQPQPMKKQLHIRHVPIG